MTRYKSQGFNNTFKNARKTVVENYDLKMLLAKEMDFLKKAANKK